MIQMKNTSIMKTAEELRIERETHLKSINEKRSQEVEEWLIANSEKIEKQIVANGFCKGKIEVLQQSVFGVFHNSENYPYEFGAVSIITYNLIRQKLEELGFRVTSEICRSPAVCTINIALPSMLARDAVRL
jgi:hypothetical protein